MKNRIVVILLAFIFISLLVFADKFVKVQNTNKINPEVEKKEENETTRIVEVTSESFDKEVLKSDKKVLVDFYATWCGPCRLLSPIIEEVSKERNDIEFVKIDVDEVEDIANEYGINAIPTLVVFENGEEINRNVGFIDKEEINDLLD